MSPCVTPRRWAGPASSLRRSISCRSSRGRGLGRQVLEWIFTQYPDSRRFRLEVTQMNQGAAHLYEKCGFQYLCYDQMVLDR